jgi:hypothetical protein
MSFVESSSAPDLSNSSVIESTFTTVDLTYIIIYSTTTTIGLTSTATNQASYDDTARSSYKLSRARIKQTLSSKLALLCLAR